MRRPTLPRPRLPMIDRSRMWWVWHLIDWSSLPGALLAFGSVVAAGLLSFAFLGWSH